MTTGKFTLVIRWPSGQSTICGEMTDHQHGEICRILSPDYRAQPIQGGEAVEVVGWACHFQIEVLRHVPLTGGMKVSGRERERYHIPLMTVAQHQSILAASLAITGDHKPIAVLDFGDLFPTSHWSAPEHRFLWQITADEVRALPKRDIPLYTHPADQVVEGVVVSRELLEQIAVELEHDNDRYFLGRELRALLNGGRA